MVLIIEGEATLARLWAELVTRDGFDVHLAADAREARRQFQRHVPDLIVLDAQLPDVSGYALCQEIRQRGDMRATPLVMISACARPVDAKKGLALGADVYLGKPFCTHDLLGAIRGLIAARRKGKADND
ncbi:response regulator transcription factor [Stappia stellulata]|uniref:response regulator transcription factor n=1 Tax=Stappia stellulata TaxID=71235 RepID=UPI00056C8BE7|nr:response regulator [Stappia stellulata]